MYYMKVMQAACVLVIAWSFQFQHGEHPLVSCSMPQSVSLSIITALPETQQQRLPCLGMVGDSVRQTNVP